MADIESLNWIFYESLTDQFTPGLLEAAAPAVLGFAAVEELGFHWCANDNSADQWLIAAPAAAEVLDLRHFQEWARLDPAYRHDLHADDPPDLGAVVVHSFAHLRRRAQIARIGIIDTSGP